MSEAGKVSLPTPERVQELKGRYEGLSPEDITFMTVGELTGLLAALEETQHQLHDQDEALIAANGLIEDLQIQLAEAQQQNERLRKNFMFSGSALAEAQQTIAWAIQIYETADMESDFDHVLTGMYETLKGGETQP